MGAVSQGCLNGPAQLLPLAGEEAWDDLGGEPSTNTTFNGALPLYHPSPCPEVLTGPFPPSSQNQALGNESE